MNQKKLRRMRRKLADMRRGIANMPSRKLERFARSLERRHAKRGREPNWISNLLPQSRPISIPHHSGTVTIGVANNILDSFERDLDELEVIVEKSNQRRNGHE